VQPAWGGERGGFGGRISPPPRGDPAVGLRDPLGRRHMVGTVGDPRCRDVAGADAGAGAPLGEIVVVWFRRIVVVLVIFGGNSWEGTDGQRSGKQSKKDSQGV